MKPDLPYQFLFIIAECIRTISVIEIHYDVLLQRDSVQQHQHKQSSTASVVCPAEACHMAEALTLEAAFLTMLTYTSPFVFASPVSCDAASEISSATEDAASDAAVQHQAALSQRWLAKPYPLATKSS